VADLIIGGLGFALIVALIAYAPIVRDRRDRGEGK
jgi:hypothetical protein